MTLYDFTKSYAMLEEAKKYVPNGIYGPRSPMFLTYGSYPCFLARGEGCHIWDVDGNEYIDYMCSFGTNILGLCHPGVEEAAKAQMDRGNCFTLPSDRWIDTAKRLVGLIDGMDWTVFAKNGTDVTTFAVTVARQHTQKRIIFVAHDEYHGNAFWVTHSTNGIPEEYKAYVVHFTYNDLDELTELFKKHKNDVAGVMLTPYHHPAMADQEMPKEGFLKGVRSLCDAEGALLIMDDIRCNLRLHINGSHAYFGVDVDMVTMGKAMANGHPIAAGLGKGFVKEAAENVYFSGTHYFSAVPMAASLKTLDIIEEEGVIEQVAAQGKKLREGMTGLAKTHGLKVSYTGHDAMPFMRFEDDQYLEKNRLFCGEVARRGVFLHPHHNWFLSAAHTDEDIAKTLDVVDECFKIVKEQS